MLSWIILLISIPFILLGAHGLYAYFHPLETLFGLSSGKLFFIISVPSGVSDLVIWMSLKGFQSFFIPVIILAIGIGLIWYAKNRGFYFSIPHWRIHRSRYSDQHERYKRYIRTRPRYFIIKTIFSLVIIFGIVTLVWFGYRLFTHDVEPLYGAIIFLVSLAVLIILIWLLRKKYIWFKPSFKIVTLILIIIVIVFSFAGVEPFKAYKDNISDIFSNKTTSSALQSTKFNTGSITWEVLLKSYSWNGTKISTEIVAFNRGKTPADFPYENASSLGVVIDFGVSDSYGMWYGTDGYQNFNVKKIYPGESRTFKPSFTVNSRSGDVTLYVTRYTGTSKFALFKLKSPN